MNNDEWQQLQEDDNEELNFANELDLQKELYNLKELKKELNGEVIFLNKNNIKEDK